MVGHVSASPQPALLTATWCHVCRPPSACFAVLGMFDYVFPENGLAAYHHGELLAEASIVGQLGEANLQRFINETLRYLGACAAWPLPAVLRRAGLAGVG